ncbi:MAG TPA: UDP-N-acetylglucosamine 2-epimerase (non-hydrolyzing) [Coxiellaceae bacterium]|nr:MAG: UDP-N-acetylglucosamine 2-epimerase [Gammaproteobacteria bacterium RIFCSPHIGHO2_12_FULL_36_30]HLB55891.1 UDP-N-acetylglucosamine 2-epimerase (non-hydrolyzing) [Coxiellaceae bacterium]
MKFLFVFGTRPEAIKLCPLILYLKKIAHVEVCITGQHKELIEPILTLFQITPNYDLALLQPNQALSDLSARCIQAISTIYQAVQPDCVIVQGDTTTSMCAALSAFYQKIPVAHVEAGLRTYELYSPFPEEINRQIISRIAHYHFVPTERNKNNLITEGCDPKNIFVTGNTGIDALLWILKNKTVSVDSIIDLKNKKLILVTGHRREHFGLPFEQLCYGIKKIAEAFPDVVIVYPVHLNPNVQKPVQKILNELNNVKLIPPLNYPDFVALMSKASLILTDSGGVQEEAPSLNVPILVMRDATERQESVEQGFSFLVGTDSQKIFNFAKKCLLEKDFYQPIGGNPYGDGKAVEKIAAILQVKIKKMVAV